MEILELDQPYLFFCMTNDKRVDIINVQILLCIVYHNEIVGPTILIQQMKCKKGLITYFMGYQKLIKHMCVEHSKLFQKLSKEMMNTIRRSAYLTNF